MHIGKTGQKHYLEIREGKELCKKCKALFFMLASLDKSNIIESAKAGIIQWLECELPKLEMRVRFSLPAPFIFEYFSMIVNEQYKLLGRKVEDLRQKEDFYPTPRYVTEALLNNYKFEGKIWEPACGDGRLSEVLLEHYADVESSDLVDRGYGIGGVDFLNSVKTAPNIITNPPFHLAYEFIVQGLKLSEKCLALLLPIRYLTGKKRAKLYAKFPPAKVIVIPNKVDFLGFGSPAMEFAWFVWEKGVTQTSIIWADVQNADLKEKRRKK